LATLRRRILTLFREPSLNESAMRSTPPNEHRPVLLAEALDALVPQPGQIIVDATVGFAGHAAEFLRRVGPAGRLIGLDLDAENLARANTRLEPIGFPFSLHHANFAGLPQVLAAEGLLAVDAILADVGVSSMQIDDAGRGFSFVRDGPLDMRMDRSRGKTAAQLLATLSFEDLAAAFREFGDEPQAEAIARALIAKREIGGIARTTELADLIAAAAPVRIEKPGPGVPTPRQQRLRPAARVFQALRILVNRELANLTALLRVLPAILNPDGRACVISFHSGEDRLAKQAFRDGLRMGFYSAVSDEAVRATWAERQANPRARSAKLRWARRTG
jgi:16S rRNA (cytosine1402-N4)-methyltransferase